MKIIRKRALNMFPLILWLLIAKKNVQDLIQLPQNAQTAHLLRLLVIKSILSAPIIIDLILKDLVKNVCLLLAFWWDRLGDMLIMLHSWTLLMLESLLDIGKRKAVLSKEWLIYMVTTVRIQITPKVLDVVLKLYMIHHNFVIQVASLNCLTLKDMLLTW